MYALAKQLTTQNLNSTSPSCLIWNIATFVINTNLDQNDLKFFFVLFSSLFCILFVFQNAGF